MAEYWEDRYLNKGKSGPGSRGAYRERKWDIINKLIPNIQDVIDVGCGDLEFWEGLDCEKYVGIDMSETVIKQNRTLRSRWGFIHGKAEDHIQDLKAETVFCLDVLFHIMNELNFTAILRNLCSYTSKNLVIYTWDENPFSRMAALKRHDIKYLLFPSDNDGKYQYFRPLEKFFFIFRRAGLQLIHKEKIGLDPFGAFYFFMRSIPSTTEVEK